MELLDALNGVRVRAPWISAGRPMLLGAGFNIGRGYEKTIAAALQEPPNVERLDRLIVALTEHLISGEKLLQLVKLKSGEKKQIATWVQGKRRYSNALTDAFPGVAAKADVLQYHGGAPFSVGTVEPESGSAAIFTAVRSYVDSVEVPSSRLRPGVADDFERIVGYQRVFVQTYEAVWVPEHGDYVCLAVDLPRGVPKQFADASIAALQYQVSQQLGRQLEYSNFWPAVDGLYKAKGGRLVDYGFSVSGQSVNHHKARRRTECLRKAVYDAAGAAAVGDDLELFRVAMRWSLKRPDGSRSEPELLVPGMAADLNKAMPQINYVILRDSLTSRDLNFVLSKLIPHLE